MRNFNQILILGILNLILIESCSNKDNLSLNIQLPIAKNFSNKPSCDSSIFSIELKDSSVLIRDYKAYVLTKHFEDIGSFLCNELKNGNIKTYCNYPISLFIDSLTSFSTFDRLIEELELIGFHAAFLRTTNKGFFIAFPYKENLIQDNVVLLYGERFLHAKSILYECKDTALFSSKSLDTLPPPPPPPPLLIPISTYDKLKQIDSSNTVDFCILKTHRGAFYINNHNYNLDSCYKILYNIKAIYVKLDKENTYSDLIRTIDLINSVQNKKYDAFSIQKFKQKYYDLNMDDSRQIRREFGIRYLILSLAEQKYIDKK